MQLILSLLILDNRTISIKDRVPQQDLKKNPAETKVPQTPKKLNESFKK